MKNHFKSYISIFLLFTNVFFTINITAEESSCDSKAERTLVEVKISSGTYNDSGDEVKFKKSCSDEIITVKKCSIEKKPEKEIQTFCFPDDGKPSYTEDYQEIMYYVIK
jgi:hypothetical protein